MPFIDDEIVLYAENHTTKESVEAKNIIEQSDEQLHYIDMLSGRVVGQFLAMLVRISGAKRVLEIGTFTGYSALRMAEALPEDGHIITCDVNERYAKIARDAFRKSKYGHKIQLKMGPALQTIEMLNNPVDLIFLDADKNNYPNYYKAVLPLLKPGALLIVDNVLWDGTVLAPADEKARSIHQLNQMIAEDERVEQVMLTVRDGLTFIRRKK